MFSISVAVVALASASVTATVVADTSAARVLDGVAIFILATTKPFNEVSSLESRLTPVAETWTRAYAASNVYHVMGTNYFDWSYLRRNCKLRRIEGSAVATELEVVGQDESNDVADVPKRMSISDISAATRRRMRSVEREGSGHQEGEEETEEAEEEEEGELRSRVHRRLLANTKQRKSEDRRLVWECDYSKYVPSMPMHAGAGDTDTAKKAEAEEAVRAPKPKTMNVLFTANCTGEYFGYGPACRFQEALRFYTYHKQRNKLIKDGFGHLGSGSESGMGGGSASNAILKKQKSLLFGNTKWFIFIDDDLYIRPYSLQVVLNSLGYLGKHATHAGKGPYSPTDKEYTKGWERAVTTANGGGLGPDYTTSEPVALLDAEKSPSFKFSKRWVDVASCNVGGVHNIYLAMPAILNDATVSLMQTALDANAMTTAQLKWGGSHDMLLGMLLWMYSVNTYSISRSYFGGRIYAETAAIYNFSPRRDILIHAVKNMVLGQGKNKNKEKHKKKRIVPEDVETLKAEAEVSPIQSMYSMYDVAVRFQDCTYPENKGDNICDRYGRKFTTRGIPIEDTLDAEMSANPPFHDMAGMVRNQVIAGVEAMKSVGKLPASRIDVTVYGEKAKNLAEEFHYFDFTDCNIKEEAKDDLRTEDEVFVYWPATKDRTMNLMELFNT